jgi:HEAT repeat protein
MVDQRLWTALRATVQRRHGRSSAESWALVSDVLHKVEGALGGRTVADVPALIALAQDPSVDAETRARVCWILGRVGIRAARAALMGLTGDHAAAVRVAAVNALGELGARRAWTVLARAARRDPDVEVRCAAVYSLQYFSSNRSANVLRAVFDNHAESSLIRGQAAESLARMGRAGRRGVPALRAALAEPTAEIRFWAAYALGYLGTEEVVEDLHRLVDDGAVVEPFGSVGEEARQAISTIRGLTEVQ